jgi:hypothetical protein
MWLWLSFYREQSCDIHCKLKAGTLTWFNDRPGGVFIKNIKTHLVIPPK